MRQIITELQKIYDKAEPQKVESDILGYLSLLNDQRALDFVAEEASAGGGAKLAAEILSVGCIFSGPWGFSFPAYSAVKIGFSR